MRESLAFVLVTNADAPKPDVPKPNVPKTFRSGPSDPVCFNDGPGTFVEVDIAAPPSAVWPLLLDINLPSEYSEEFQSARWPEGVDGPSLGARFIGANKNAQIGEWELDCFIDKFDPESSFGWITSDQENPGASWWYKLTPTDAGCHLRYEVSLGPGPSGLTHVIGLMPEKEPRIINGRLRELHTTMQRNVDGIGSRAEAAS